MATISAARVIDIISFDETTQTIESDLRNSGIFFDDALVDVPEVISEAAREHIAEGGVLSDFDFIREELFYAIDSIELNEFIDEGTTADNVTHSDVASFSDNNSVDIVEALRRAIVDDAVSCIMNSLLNEIEEKTGYDIFVDDDITFTA